MSDGLLHEHSTSPKSQRGWLVGLWIASTVFGTTVWWAGLAWAAMRLAEAVS